MTTKRIKPVGKRYVQFPDNGHRLLDPQGEDVVMDQFWYRRLNDGDIAIVEPAEPVEVEATKPQTKESN